MNHTHSPLQHRSPSLLQTAGLGRKALAAFALTLAIAGTAQAQTYANVTVGGAFAPGVYGQISLGNNPAPPVWNAQPMVVGRPVYGAPVMYLHVPQQEYRDWGRYCGHYRACGRPVHFVRVDNNNRWWDHQHGYQRGYNNDYRRAEERRDDRRDERRYDRRDERRDERRHERRQDIRADWQQERYNQATDPRFESIRGER